MAKSDAAPLENPQADEATPDPRVIHNCDAAIPHVADVLVGGSDGLFFDEWGGVSRAGEPLVKGLSAAMGFNMEGQFQMLRSLEESTRLRPGTKVSLRAMIAMAAGGVTHPMTNGNCDTPEIADAGLVGA